MGAPRVALALVDPANPFQQLLKADAEVAAARFGVALTTVFTGENFTEQLATLRALVTNPAGPPQAIVVMSVRDQGALRVVRDGAAAGVHWAFVNPVEDDLDAIRREFPLVCIATVCPDELEAGRLQGRQMRALLPRSGRALYMQGSSRSLTSRLRTAGMVEATAGCGNEIVLAGGEWSRQAANETMLHWLRLAGGRRAFDLVTCQNDDLAQGVLDALASAIRAEPARADLKRVRVTGCDGAPEVGQAMVRSGSLAATVVLPRAAGPAVELMARLLLRGQRPADRVALAPSSFPAAEELRPVA